jgi:hypothetical protein
MKNIYLLHTETPSRLFIDLKGKLMFNTDWTEIPIGRINQYIYITSDEKPKDGDWCFNPKTNKTTKVGHHGHYGYSSKKIILTTDPDLIKEGVQDIKNEFLEWFVNNPSCEEVKILKCPIEGLYTIDLRKFIPQQEPKQVTNFYEELKKYFENTPRGKILEDWAKSAESDKIGPTVEDFLKENPCRQINITPQQEPKKYPIGGYAPGFYSCKCVTCKKEFIGDKRAVQCEPCAIKTINAQEEPKQETLEEAAEIFYPKHKGLTTTATNKIMLRRAAWIHGAKWMEERMYSEGEVLVLLHKRDKHNLDNPNTFNGWKTPKEWFENNKKK